VRFISKKYKVDLIKNKNQPVPGVVAMPVTPALRQEDQEFQVSLLLYSETLSQKPKQSKSTSVIHFVIKQNIILSSQKSI
jgi:hypothetical protein